MADSNCSAPVSTALDNEIILHAPVGIVVSNVDGTIQKANYAYLELLGCNQDNLRGKSFREITHPDDIHKANALYQNLMAGDQESGKIEVRSKMPAGQWLWTAVNARLIRHRDGSPSCFVAYIEDISQKKYLEETQERTLEKNNALLQATRVALQTDDFTNAAHILYDHCRVLIGATCGYVALLSGDKTEGEILFMEEGGLERTTSENDQVPLQGYAAEAVRSGNPVYTNCIDGSDDNIFFPENSRGVQNVLFAPLVLESESIGLMGFAQKNSGFNPEDAQTASAFSDLVAIVLKRSEIQKKNLQLQQAITQADRLSSMGRLAAGICHELNNPLSYVSYSIDSLREDVEALSATLRNLLSASEQDPETQHHVIDKLVGEFDKSDMHKRLNLAYEGMLKIKDIAATLGSFSLTKKEEQKPVFVNAAVEDAINMSMYEIKYRAKLVKEFGVASAVLASPGRLAQCILNLIMNAAQSIEPGNVENGEIKIRTWQKSDQVFFQISDTGCGIPESEISQVFEPLYTTKENAGTGLGLSICKQIVDELNGNIDIVSAPGTGTTVTICLPMHQKSVEDYVKRQLDVISPDRFVPGRILLVDDEDGIRAALQRILRKHNTVEAQSGKSAIDVLQNDTNFDLILCDMMMPKTSGIDVHKWIMKHLPALAEDVVFMTGGVFTDDAKKHLADFHPAVINKPFNRSAISQLVDQRIASKQSEKRN